MKSTENAIPKNEGERYFCPEVGKNVVAKNQKEAAKKAAKLEKNNS